MKAAHLCPGVHRRPTARGTIGSQLEALRERVATRATSWSRSSATTG